MNNKTEMDLRKKEEELKRNIEESAKTMGVPTIAAGIIMLDKKEEFDKMAKVFDFGLTIKSHDKFKTYRKKIQKKQKNEDRSTVSIDSKNGNFKYISLVDLVDELILNNQAVYDQIQVNGNDQPSEGEGILIEFLHFKENNPNKLHYMLCLMMKCEKMFHKDVNISIKFNGNDEYKGKSSEIINKIKDKMTANIKEANDKKNNTPAINISNKETTQPEKIPKESASSANEQIKSIEEKINEALDQGISPSPSP